MKMLVLGNELYLLLRDKVTTKLAALWLSHLDEKGALFYVPPARQRWIVLKCE